MVKKLLLFPFFLVFLFLVSFGAARFKPQAQAILAKIRESEKISFHPTAYPLKNRPFTIVAIGRNNGASVDKTLRSILHQTYENYRVVYVDDASDDGSFTHARDLIYDSGVSHKVHFIQNEHPIGSVGNLSQVIASCDDEEIIVLVEGEDFLAHEWVLQRLNQYFANPDLWLALGQYMTFPSYSLGPKESYLHSDIRHCSSELSFNQLKVFYAALFKKIDTSDLRYHGEFMPDSARMAYMIPLLEMAKDHIQSLDEILYLKQEKWKKKDESHFLCETKIKEKEAYFPLPQILNFNPL